MTTKGTKNTKRPGLGRGLLVFFVPFVVTSLLYCLAPVWVSAAQDLEIRVSAGSHDRRDTPVSAVLPAGVAAVRLLETTDGGSRELVCQVEPGTPPRLHWILDGHTRAGSVRTFRALPVETSGTGKVVVSVHDEKGEFFELRAGDRKLLRYNYGIVPPPGPEIPEIQARNAYIHPVWTPSGRVITMDYPPQHLHHRGIWFPWTKTEFEGRDPDFWNLGDGKGTVRFDRVDQVFSGPVFGGFRVRHRHVDLTAPGGEKDALHESWDVKVFAVGLPGNAYLLFDLLSVQECAGPSPLKLPQYRYGGLGFRGSREWEGDRVRFLTSEGKTRQDGHGTRARWCSISGPLGEASAGVVIYCHPENYRFPQNMRIHPTEPFFCYAPVQAGDMEIVPGKPYVSRYRFYVHDGDLFVAEAERHWRDYGQPPLVEVVPSP